MRIFIVALALIYCAGASMAASVLVGPSKCPVAAELGPLAAGNAEAGDLNRWRSVGAEIDPVIDIDLEDKPQSDRLFARFRADGETGKVGRLGKKDDCN